MFFRRQGSQLELMRRPLPVFLLIFVLVISMGIPGRVGSQTGILVSVSPALVLLESGESAAIEIWVENVTALFGFEVDVQFDPQKISVSSLALGEFLEAGWIVKSVFDNENGSIEFDMTQTGTETESKSGSGVLISFDILLKEEVAETNLSITSVLLTDRNGIEIPTGVQNGLVRTPSVYDVLKRVYLPLVLD